MERRLVVGQLRKNVKPLSFCIARMFIESKIYTSIRRAAGLKSDGEGCRKGFPGTALDPSHMGNSTGWGSAGGLRAHNSN